MYYDLHSNVKGVRAISPATVTGAGTTTGETIDTVGYESLEYIIATGTVTAVSATSDLFTIQESDTGSGGWTDVDASEQLGGTIATLQATDDDKVFRIGVISKKRYQRIVLTRTGASANYLVSAVAVLSNPKSAPVADQST